MPVRARVIPLCLRWRAGGPQVGLLGSCDGLWIWLCTSKRMRCMRCLRQLDVYLSNLRDTGCVTLCYGARMAQTWKSDGTRWPALVQATCTAGVPVARTQTHRVPVSPIETFIYDAA